MTNKKKGQSRVHSKNSARQSKQKGSKKLQLPNKSPTPQQPQIPQLQQQPKTQLIPSKLQIGLGTLDHRVARNNRSEISDAEKVERNQTSPSMPDINQQKAKGILEFINQDNQSIMIEQHGDKSHPKTSKNHKSHKNRKTNKSLLNQNEQNGEQLRIIDASETYLQYGQVDGNQDHANDYSIQTDHQQRQINQTYFGSNKGSKDLSNFNSIVQSTNAQRNELQNFAIGYPQVFSQEKHGQGKSSVSNGAASTDNSKLLNSGRHVIAAHQQQAHPLYSNHFELSRQKQLVQQQQKHFSQHQNSVVLEIKGNTTQQNPKYQDAAEVFSNSNHNSRISMPAATSTVSQSAIPTQQQPKTVLHQLQMQVIPPQEHEFDITVKKQNNSKFGHHSANIKQVKNEYSHVALHQQNGSQDRADSPQKIFQGGMHDSKGPFESVNQRTKGPVSTSPVVLVKKKGSAKYSQRKQSGVLTMQSSSVGGGRAGANLAPTQIGSTLVQLAQNTLNQGYQAPPSQSHVVPMTVFGQKSMQGQHGNQLAATRQSLSNKNSSHHVATNSVNPSGRVQQVYVIAEKDVIRKAGSSEEPIMTKNKSKGSLIGGVNHPYPALSMPTRNSIKQERTQPNVASNSQMQSNMSGLLNMSKQRACLETKEGVEVQQPSSPSANGQATHTTQHSHFATNTDAKFNESLQAQEAHGSSHKRHDRRAIHGNHQLYSHSTNGHFGSGTQSFGDSLQTSGKQIIQGQAYAYKGVKHGKTIDSKFPASAKVGTPAPQSLIRAFDGQLSQHEQVLSQQTPNICPLSIFEMQFYNGDFVLNNNNPKSQVNYPSHHPQFISSFAPQQPNSLKHSGSNSNLQNSPGLSQTHKQNLTHQQMQQLQFLKAQGSNIANQVSSAQHRSAHSTQASDKGKINHQALYNFHQQWQGNNLGGAGPTQTQIPTNPVQLQLQVQLANIAQQTQQQMQQQKQFAMRASGGSQSQITIQQQRLQGGSSQSVNGTPLNQKHAQLNPKANFSPNPISGSLPINHTLPLQAVTYQNVYGTPVQVSGKQMTVPITGHPPHLASSYTQYSQVQQAQINQHMLMMQGYQNLMNQDQLNPADLLLQQELASHIGTYQQQIVATVGRKRREKHISKIPFENAYVEDCYKFIIVPGNNSGLVRKALERRSWWIEIQPVHSMFNFKWQPFSTGLKFGRLGHIEDKKMGDLGSTSQFNNFTGAVSKGSANIGQSVSQAPMSHDKTAHQMVNHFERHQLLTEKYNLLLVMQKFCDLHKENAFDLMPITFYVEIADASRDAAITQALQPFVQFYQSLEINKDKMASLHQTLYRQLHQRAEMLQQMHNDVDEKTGKPSAHFTEKIQRLESVTGTILHEQKQATSGKVTKFKTFNFEKRTHMKYSMPLCHFDSYNLWLLKPTHLNRGRGIHVFRDVETLVKLIKQYCSGKEEVAKKKSSATVKDEETKAAEGNDSPDIHEGIIDSDNEMDPVLQTQKTTSSPQKNKREGSSPNKIKHNTFIIQKYIEKPLLIFKRKFDIRVWVLLNQDHELFFFKEGYLRTSSSEFGIDLQNIDNAFVHLTNNAVQKHAENYGDFEDGNMLSFPRFQQYIDEYYPESGVDVHRDLVPQMHEIILKTFNAVKKTIDPSRRKFCFELFGYDFILDEDFNTWLIEVNTNPCLEESSQLLVMLLPRMIEDMLKLTVDISFPKSSISKKGKKGNKEVKRSPQKQSSKEQTIPQREQTPRSNKRLNTATKLKLINEKSSADKDESEKGEASPTFATPSETPTPLKATTSQDEGVMLKTQSDIEQKTQLTGNPTMMSIIEETVSKPESDAKKDKAAASNKRIHPVTGYSDSENMWQKLVSLERDNVPNVSKYPNNKSAFTIQVQDKVFKLKKNPAYTGPLNLPVLPDLHPDPEIDAGAAAAEDQPATLEDDAAYSKVPEAGSPTPDVLPPQTTQTAQPNPASVTNTT